MAISNALPTDHQQHSHRHTQNRFAVIPTAQRLEADSEYTGRGVVIAFLDSGFTPHPDLTLPENRIIAYEDVAKRKAPFEAKASPQAWEWHGSQTSVVAAGNGFLSDGVYRGLASSASLVLVKVSDSRGRQLGLFRKPKTDPAGQFAFCDHCRRL